MRYGLIGSIILHFVIFGFVIFNFTSSRKNDARPAVPVSVEMMSPQEFSERQAGTVEGKAAKPVPPAEVKAPDAAASAKKEVEQKPPQKPAEREALLPPPPALAPPAAAAAKSAEQAKAEPRPEKPVEKPVPKPAKKEPGPKPAPKPKPEIAKKAEQPEVKRAEAAPFDPSRIEAFVNDGKAQAARSATAPSTMEARPSKTYSERQSAVLNRVPDAGAPAGDYDPSKPWRPASSLQDQAMGLPQARGAMNAGSCADAVQSRIEQNWILPIGAQSAEDTVIRLRIELNRDGTLARPPAVLDQSASPVYQAMARAAVSAAESGQPFIIPPQQYERCRDMILRFNPRDMYGG